jgi:hypothetical protein
LYFFNVSERVQGKALSNPSTTIYKSNKNTLFLIRRIHIMDIGTRYEPHTLEN